MLWFLDIFSLKTHIKKRVTEQVLPFNNYFSFVSKQAWSENALKESQKSNTVEKYHHIRRVRLEWQGPFTRGTGDVYIVHCSLVGIFFLLLRTECCAPSPKSMCCNPNPQCDSIRGGGGLWEVTLSGGEAPVNGISALKRRDTRQLVPLSVSRPVRTQQGDSHLQTRKGTFLRTWPPGQPDRRLLSLQSCEK